MCVFVLVSTTLIFIYRYNYHCMPNYSYSVTYLIEFEHAKNHNLWFKKIYSYNIELKIKSTTTNSALRWIQMIYQTRRDLFLFKKKIYFILEINMRLIYNIIILIRLLCCCCCCCSLEFFSSLYKITSAKRIRWMNKIKTDYSRGI